jgi:hypothetical protein
VTMYILLEITVKGDNYFMYSERAVPAKTPDETIASILAPISHPDGDASIFNSSVSPPQVAIGMMK